MKVSACEIIISQVDHTRMDLVIPGEKYYYLKASSSQERQQWLIALGSAKAHLCSKHICDQGNGLNKNILVIFKTKHSRDPTKREKDEKKHVRYEEYTMKQIMQTPYVIHNNKIDVCNCIFTINL